MIIRIHHIISKCCKLAQKDYKTRHEAKVIHWDICKKFKFDHTNKWYMHNPAPLLENDTHKLLCDFDIYTDHLISARWQDLILINNKKREFAKLSTLLSLLTTELNMEECEKKDKYLDVARELKKTMEHESDDCTNCDWCFWHSTGRIINGPGGFGSWRTSGDHPNDSIIEDDQNTEKCPGDCHSKSSKKSSADADVNYSKRV